MFAKTKTIYQPGRVYLFRPKAVSLPACGILLMAFFSACSVSQRLSKQAKKNIINDSAFSGAHVGISIFEPSTGKYWYNYQAEKYYVPASNTKLFSLYAGMKYLGDSLPAARYFYDNDTLFILPGGDPTFLHPDFKSQRLFDFLKSSKNPIAVINSTWQENALGSGWSWDDYNDDYMAERSSLPVYANIIKWIGPDAKSSPPGNTGRRVISQPRIPWLENFTGDTRANSFFVKRNFTENIFNILPGEGSNNAQEVPFVTHGIKSALILLKDTLKVTVTETTTNVNKILSTLYSVPADSVYKIMMYRSDNFFAEQILLMTANVKLLYMNDQKIIDTILSLELKDIPQKPAWADGSGLSRYNLFSCKDFIYILNKLKNEFGLDRMKSILPSGGAGTLRVYYLKDSGFIYAKTGSLSNVAAISGYLFTKKNKLLVFSLLANNFIAPPGSVRRAFEKFLTGIRRRY